jgi:hypothetical protein
VSTIDASGHIRSQVVCASGVWSVHFVDVDVIDGCTGDGSIEAGEELLEGLACSPAKERRRKTGPRATISRLDPTDYGAC